MTDRTEHPTLIARASELYVGGGKAQVIVYGLTFVITLAVALVADLGLGHSQASVALFSIGLAAVLLLVMPIGSLKLFGDKAREQDVYPKLQQDIMTLQMQVKRLVEQAEAASRPYEIPISAEVETNLGMLASDSKALSIIHYIQDVVYKELTDLRVESMYAAGEGLSSRKLSFPAGMKGLLEQLAEAKGFPSVEDYLADTVRERIRKLQERDEMESAEQARRRAFIQGHLPYPEQNLPRPSTENSSIFNDREFNGNRFPPLMPEHSAGSPEEL